MEIKTKAKLPKIQPCMGGALYQDGESSEVGSRTEVLFCFDLGGWVGGAKTSILELLALNQVGVG